MHDVRPRGKRKRRVSPEVEEEAVRTALHLLFPLKFASWDEYDSDADNPALELQHAIVLVECALSEDQPPNDIFQFCYLPRPSPFIELARKAAIPILKRARPPAGSKSGAHSWRDQLIIETIRAVGAQHNLKATRNPASRDEEHDPSCCSVVAKALGKLGSPLSEKRITDEIWLKRTPPK